MTTYRVQPLSTDRPLATVRLGEKTFEIFPAREFVTSYNALLQRIGGADTDAVAAALTIANQALSLAQSAPVAAVAAYDAGAPAGYALAPANPVTIEDNNKTTARVSIAAHTRTPSGMGAIALNSGFVDIARGENNVIYYNDPTDAGGAVAYLATTNASLAGDYAAGNRIVGAAYSPPFVTPFGGSPV